jgi:hypothetical protein
MHVFFLGCHERRVGPFGRTDVLSLSLSLKKREFFSDIVAELSINLLTWKFILFLLSSLMEFSIGGKRRHLVKSDATLTDFSIAGKHQLAVSSGQPFPG